MDPNIPIRLKDLRTLTSTFHASTPNEILHHAVFVSSFTHFRCWMWWRSIGCSDSGQGGRDGHGGWQT